MKNGLKRFFKFGAIPLLLIVFIYVAYTTQFNYWRVLYFLKIAHEVVPMQYELQSLPATTTPLVFDKIQLTVPWSGITLSKVHQSTANWSFGDNQNSLVIFFSTTTTRVIWSENPDIENILPLNSLSSYELERMIWRIQKNELPLWATKNNNAGRNLMLAGIKTVKYSWCDELLEFQNTHDVKGVICEWGIKEGEKKSIVYFYLGDDDSEYNFFIKPNQIQIRDSIIASIKRH